MPTIATSVPRAAFAGVTAQAASRKCAAAGRDQPHQHAGRRRRRSSPTGGADMVSMARPLLADPEWVNKAARRSRATRSIPASPATRPAWTMCSRTSARAAWSIRAPARNRTELHQAAATPKRIAVVGAGPGRPGLRHRRGRTRPSRHAVRCRRRDRRPVQPRQAHSRARKSSTRPCATSRRASRSPASTCGCRHARRRRRLLAEASTTSSSPPASPRARSTIAGIDHPKVVSYLDVLSGRVNAGVPAVAIIGAGGIGFDVAEFLVARRPRRRRWIRSAGWPNGASTPTSQRAAAWRQPQPEPPARKVWLLQRTTGKPGARLGKTTGWIHRATLKAKGVKMLGGVEYLGVDDAGLHIRVDGSEQTPAGRPRGHLRRPGTAPRPVRRAAGAGPAQRT